MKTWKNAEIVALNVEETANGFFDFYFESPLDIIVNDNLKKKPVTEDNTDPATPGENNDPISQQS